MYEIKTFMNGELMEIFEFDTLKDARAMYKTLRKLHREPWVTQFWSITTKGFIS